MQVLLNEQKSCTMNCNLSTKHFKLEKGTFQDDSISGFVHVYVYVLIFSIIHLPIYTYILSNIDYVKEAINNLNRFSNFFDLISNVSKCKTIGIKMLKGVNVALLV